MFFAIIGVILFASIEKVRNSPNLINLLLYSAIILYTNNIPGPETISK